jgi:uncharacterized protein
VVQVRVVGLAVDSRSQPVILLKPILEEPGTGTMLPIWIGAQEATSIFIAVEGAEATSIFIAVEGAEAPRPLVHP